MAISCQPISVESPYVEPVHEHGHSLALVLTRFGGHLEAGAAPPPEGVLVGREDHQGRLCLATILDCCSRRIVGYSMDCRMKASRVVAALRDAIGLKGSGEHHRALGPRQPDRVQGFTRRLQQAGIAASMGGVGTAYDDAAAESLFATIRRELVHRHRFPTRAAARTAILEFIEVFSTTPTAQLDRDDGASRVRKEGARTAGGGYRCLA